MAERNARDSKVPDKVLLKPFDVTKFGSEDDPCFGKEYDLNADECQICGDIEICSIAFAQKQLRVRAQLEAENKFKDLEEVSMVSEGKVRDFIQAKRMEGWGDTKIKIKIRTKFNLTKEQSLNFF
jgi:hypothetical protein